MGERVAIIVGMGLGTYLLRVFPLLVGHRLPMGPRLIRWFQFLSFSVIASFVWFGLIKGTASPGTLGFRSIALGLTILAAARARNSIVGMAVGVGVVLLLSQVGW